MRTLVFLAFSFLLAGQAQRDLKFTKDPSGNLVTSDGRAAIPRSYALVVGISEFKNLPPSGQLKFPSRDAADVYTALISAEGGQFPAENVHRLLGKQATLVNLNHELEEWLPSVTKDDDRVLIYFAGHGFVYEGKAYLAPYDIDLGDVPQSSYPMGQLGKVIGGKIKGKWKVLLTVLPAIRAQLRPRRTLSKSMPACCNSIVRCFL